MRNDPQGKTYYAYYGGSPFLQIRSCPPLDPRPNTLNFLLEYSCLMYIKASYCNDLEEVPDRYSLNSAKFLCVLNYGSWRYFINWLFYMPRGSCQFDHPRRRSLILMSERWTRDDWCSARLVFPYCPRGGSLRNPYRFIISFFPRDIVPRGVFAFLAKGASFLTKCVALLISFVTLSLISLRGDHPRCLVLDSYLI